MYRGEVNFPTTRMKIYHRLIKSNTSPLTIDILLFYSASLYWFSSAGKCSRSNARRQAIPMIICIGGRLYRGLTHSTASTECKVLVIVKNDNGGNIM